MKKEFEVILEPKNSNGTKIIESCGCEFKLVKSMGIDRAKRFLIAIKSVKDGTRMIVDIEGENDNNFTVKFN